MLTQEQRVKKAHIALMKSKHTVWWGGVMMMGTSEVSDKEGLTAYTDGVNKVYGRAFLTGVCKEDAEVAGLVLHENLHIGLRQGILNRDLWVENAKLANVAADMVVNDIIMEIHKEDPNLVKLPAGGCYEERFHNMNMREVYRLLKEECKGGGSGYKPKKKGSGGGEKPTNGDDEGDEYSFDEHDFEKMDAEQAKDINERIDRAIREGAILAGRLGIDLPRAITEMLEGDVDWKKEFAEYVSSFARGKDEYTWRKFNRRLLPSDLYIPSAETETIGEVIYGIDTSGSISQQQINEFAAEIVKGAEAVCPEKIRVLWWDTKVHGEQVFQGNYQDIGKMLKPLGGGGTHVSCVSDYMIKNSVNAEVLVIFTDGYVERDIKWEVTAPTMWFVTQNGSFDPPANGRMVKVVE
jgi:predicted metal-dependent peptidase